MWNTTFLRNQEVKETPNRVVNWATGRMGEQAKLILRELGAFRVIAKTVKEILKLDGTQSLIICIKQGELLQTLTVI